MKGAAHKRAAGYCLKTHLQGNLAPPIKLFWGHKAFHLQVIPGGLKVLAKRKHLAAHLHKVRKVLSKLLERFPQALHGA